MNVVYSMLLVDDESIDLEWLRRRIEGSHANLHIVDAVNSGFRAKEILAEQPVDILFTDIRMPIMSGLELAQAARELQPQIKIVFVSGHEDFEYAKQAIRVNAAAYLLKPVDNGELRDLLTELQAELDRSRQQQIQDVSDLHREFVLRWLEGLASEQVREAAINALHILGRSCSLCISIIEVDDLTRKLSGLGVQEREALLQRVRMNIERFFDAFGSGMIICDHHSRFVYIADGDVSTTQIKLRELASTVRQQLNLSITAGVGAAVKHPEQLVESYEQAKAAISRKLLSGKERLYVYEEINELRHAAASGQAKQQMNRDIQPIVDSLFEALLNYQLVEIDELLDDLFLRTELYTDKTTINNYIIHIVSRLHIHCQSIQENLYQILGWELEHLNIVHQFETIHDMKSWLRRTLFELSEKLYIRRRSQNRRIIDEIITYVQEQLDDKVTLKQVAEQFNFSPNYLGHLFREATGENFSEFLIRARLRQACKLLLNPRMKVYEVADQIGYKNILYFNRQFKKYIGVTPGEYRRSPFPVLHEQSGSSM